MNILASIVVSEANSSEKRVRIQFTIETIRNLNVKYAFRLVSCGNVQYF